MDSMRDALESGVADSDDESGTVYRLDNIGNATRLIDVLRSTIASGHITAGSKKISVMVQKFYRFQATALCSTDDLRATLVPERGSGTTVFGSRDPKAGTSKVHQVAEKESRKRAKR